MSAEVKLTITQGLSEGKVFTFRESTIGTIGRAGDCLLRLPNTLPHLDVSRHHCLLDIDPPEVWVRDLGSRNGNYVNGTLVGCTDLPRSESEFVLHDGDELRLGNTAFRVLIADECQEEHDAGSKVREGAEECPACC